MEFDKLNIGTILFDDNSSNPKSLLFSNPIEIIQAQDEAEVLGAFAKMQKAKNDGFYLCGFFSYELGYLFEEKLKPLLPKNRKVPLLWFGVYQSPKNIDFAKMQNIWQKWEAREYILRKVEYCLDAEGYRQKHAPIIEGIKNGIFYQANFTFKAKSKFFGCKLGLYANMRKKQNAGFGAYIKTENCDILCQSPELFFEKRGSKIITRPMKGTIERGQNQTEDDGNKDFLHNDIKNRAENLMIVDLMRNDISKISQNQSVKTPKLFTIETYPTLHQMTSEIVADIDENIKIIDLISAIFPSGSITGAPKFTAMEMIKEQEDEPRGIYCGSIGFIAPNNDMCFNVAIRTPVIFANGDLEIGIGSGLVYDAKANSEYEECLLKGSFFTSLAQDFSIFETIKYEKQSGFILLDEHLERLENSAKTLGLWQEYSKEYFINKLKTAVKNIKWDSVRIKLSIYNNGHNIDLYEYVNDKEIYDIAICPERINSKNPWIYHKTSNRCFYDSMHKFYSQKYGLDEIIFLNEKNHICEGSRTNIFMDFGSGILLTPSSSSGLLNGTLRAQLINQKKAKEIIIKAEDLLDEPKIYLGNSLRGLKLCRLNRL